MLRRMKTRHMPTKCSDNNAKAYRRMSQKEIHEMCVFLRPENYINEDLELEAQIFNYETTNTFIAQ